MTNFILDPDTAACLDGKYPEIALSINFMFLRKKHSYTLSNPENILVICPD